MKGGSKLFEEGDLVQLEGSEHAIGLVIKEVRSNCFPLWKHYGLLEDKLSPHDPIEEIYYYYVLFNGKKAIYPPNRLKLVKKGKSK